jgi:DNA invertase Pin-like site-specific DNA recombinase
MRERARLKTFRCAIYTRKSSEEGLEQDFNSLQAQREACESYIASQKHEGWKALPTAYDDGAYSGGTMERPALQRLLADITAGLVDVVVVYKVDRLTRALTDFAKIVEVFDQRGVSFVSVTQQFNTTSSMGRLTLNVLLSFAQFEREVTGERIRDKIAASKKKGLWMGGFVPLGYRPDQRTLVIHEAQAEIVRTIFRLYRQTGSVLKVQSELDRRGIVRPTLTTMTSGRAYGGRSFGRGEIYKLLANPIYVGEINHKGHRYEGQHPAIIDRETWDEVRARLASNTHARHIRFGAKDPSLLAGLLQDDQGNRLTPTHAVKNGKRYRYYALQPSDTENRKRGRPQEGSRRWRIAAAEIEAVVIERLAKQFDDQHWLLSQCASPDGAIARRKAIIAKGKELANRIRSDARSGLREFLLGLLTCVTLGEAQVRIDIRRSSLIAMLGIVDDEAAGMDDDIGNQRSHRSTKLSAQGESPDDDVILLKVPTKLHRRGVETKLIINTPGEAQKPSDPDPALVKLIAHAHQWWDDLLAHRFSTMRALAQAYGKDERYVARVLPLAFLAPTIVEAAAGGTQPVELTAQRLMTVTDLPDHWKAQVATLGFAKEN